MFSAGGYSFRKNFPIVSSSWERFTCRGCGAGLAATPGALALSCGHCQQVTAIYETDVILQDGLKVMHVPDTFDPSQTDVIRKKYGFPDNCVFSMGWAPHWLFQGEIEAHLSGRRYAIGVGGDRVRRVTHHDRRQISGRLLKATFHFPHEELYLEPWDAAKCEPGKPSEDEIFAPHVDQEHAIDAFEALVKQELLAEPAFQTEQCDLFEILCWNFQQALVYVPVRIWHVPNKYYESQRLWVVHYGHTGRIVKSTSTLDDLVRGSQISLSRQDRRALKELEEHVTGRSHLR